MLTINSIKNGIVIDHIRSGEGLKLFHFLGLDKGNYHVALIINADSKKYGNKDIIKIEDEININYEILGVIDPNITIDIIENERITEKRKLTLPKKVVGIMKCKNPRCVTSIEPNVQQIHYLVDEKSREYRCHYCDDLQKAESII